MTQARYDVSKQVIPAPATVVTELHASANIVCQGYLRTVPFFQQMQHALNTVGIARFLRETAVEISFRAKSVERENCSSFGNTRMPLRLYKFIAVTDGNSREISPLFFQNIQNVEVLMTPYQGMNIDTGAGLTLHSCSSA